MSKVRSYRDTGLSLIIVVTWLVIVFRIFNSDSASNDNAVSQFLWTWIITISIAMLAGIGVHLTSLIKRNGWQNKFMYNLIATFNIIIGSFGMMVPRNLEHPTPYLVAASLTVGIIMYKNIYSRSSWLSRK